MPRRTPVFTPAALDPAADEPLYLQLARVIAEDIRRGRLRPGDRIPGSRTLAEALGVHRNTVLAALGELRAQGWLCTRPAAGTFVADDIPAPPARLSRAGRAPLPELPPLPAWDQALELAEPLRPDLFPRGALGLLGGMPDLRLLPTAALGRAYRRVLRARGAELLRYDDPLGDRALREALAGLLSRRRGLSVGPEGLLITRGSQMAVYLLARAILRPGDGVAVEALGYRPAWAALRQAGARLVPVPVDDGGLDVEALAERAAREPLRAVYLTPHHQYPTTAVLAPGRRLRLLQLARAQRLFVLEDDYDHEFHYEGRPLLPLASGAAALGGLVYIGTLSKLLAPGLRVGFVAAAPALLERLAALRLIIDRQGDHAVQRAVAELIDDGEIERHAWRCRGVYLERRDALLAELSRQLPQALAPRVPAGGMALWTRVADGIDADEWAARGRERGVIVQVGRRFAFDDAPLPYLRLGFAPLTPRELREAVRRLATALPA